MLNKQARRRSQVAAVLLTVSTLVVAGCQGPPGEHLYIAHNTKLGLDASVNTAVMSGTIDLGYDRHFLTWVPRSVEVEGASGQPPAESGSGPREVMSVLACSVIETGVLRPVYYDESLATGRAATKFAAVIAKDRIAADEFFSCFFRKADPATANSSGGGTR